MDSSSLAIMKSNNVPTLKVHIAGQGAQIIEEGFANPEFVRSNLYLASSRSKTVWKRRPAD